MMSEVKKCKLLSLLLLVAATSLLITSCQKNNEPEDPYVTPGKTENPNWVVTVENDMTASVTAIVKVSFAQAKGSLAAFVGDACCGIGEYQEEYGLYWLYISPATEAGGDVQLKFYSPDLKRIFVAQETFSFRNDDIVGTIAAPFTPTWKVAE